MWMSFLVLVVTSFVTSAEARASTLGDRPNCSLPGSSRLALKSSARRMSYFLDAKMEPTGFGQPLGLAMGAPSSKLLKSGAKFRDILIGIRNSNMPAGKFFAVNDWATLHEALSEMLESKAQIAVCRFSKKKNDYENHYINVELSRIPTK